jgi:hypothetical protein
MLRQRRVYLPAMSELQALGLIDVERFPEAARLRAGVASVVPGTLSTASCSGLPVLRGRAHSRSHGEQITRDHAAADTSML